MLSVVTIIGVVGPKTDSVKRTVEVRRAYNEDKLTPTSDSFDVVLWSRNLGAPFYRIEAGNHIAIKGRLEICDGRIVVIAEQVNFF
ncbi:MAG TPA: hypothetical protein VJZ31_00480 [Bacilli bacterium]|nr:hypothetical protein [Bacilli bacterium]